LTKLQTPYKQIKVPHNGIPCIGDKFAIIEKYPGAYTFLNLENGFLGSISSGNSQVNVLCWSSYLDAFLCTDSAAPGTIMSLKPPSVVIGEQLTPSTKGNISCAVCFNNRLMLVRDLSKDRNGIGTDVEEWSIEGK
jgi:hypothetical protein